MAVIMQYADTKHIMLLVLFIDGILKKAKNVMISDKKPGF
jgi:hypothetical protein